MLEKLLYDEVDEYEDEGIDIDEVIDKEVDMQSSLYEKYVEYMKD